MANKILTLLGFAAKAGRLSFGFEAASAAVRAKKAFLVLAACDISAKSRKEITFIADKYSIPVMTLDGLDIQTVSNAVGRKCGIISVNEHGFAESLKEEILDDQ
ncbi:MAG: L7Ae/L30e/S12e/Gadd45 family ribosomal protein [Acutalibacteraceae bacterium]